MNLIRLEDLILIKFSELSFIGWINVLIIQWIFIRIWYSTDNKYGILFPIVPLSGWNGNKFIPQKFFVVELYKGTQRQ